MIYNNLEEMNDSIKDCKKCDLHKQRKNAVCGTGKIGSEIFLIGEAPGKTEDENGIPFTGRSGKLLREVLENTGIFSRGVYISNSVRCRPVDNVKPGLKNLLACNDYLRQEIYFVKPRIIVALGNTSLKALSSITGIKFEPVTKILGQCFQWNDIRIYPQFHPAAIIRNVKNLDVFINIFKEISKI
ncbi:MAG: uracil-DNA glycosylase [Thermoplasmataceae archaeon]